MAKQDLHNNVKVTPGLLAQSIASNTTVVGPIIDTQGFESVEYALQTAGITDGVFTPAIYEDDAPAMGTENVVAAADLLGTVANATFNLAADANKSKKLGYKGGKRYVRLKVTTTGITTGGAIAAVAVLSDAANKPVP
jgi:hypothetical protein